ncbi:MAG: hypothetical protein M2R45_05021 [Verrucomicrobia subdivision 3 bacterium]|nr:hypothetical protein [Limisphaerales bacterium]MCS1417652.1 hypothetical protein [Limisphaerales bacterium]
MMSDAKYSMISKSTCPISSIPERWTLTTTTRPFFSRALCTSEQLTPRRADADGSNERKSSPAREARFHDANDVFIGQLGGAVLQLCELFNEGCRHEIQSS